VSLARQLVQNPIGKRVWRWWNHRRTSIYLLSYPKTGRTWLRTMIGKALVDDLAIAGVDPLELEDVSEASPALPRIRVTHDDRPHRKPPSEIERDKRRYADKHVIFLVRDPRDVLISYYFTASKRRDWFSGTPSEFLRHPIGGLDGTIEYYNIWAGARTVPRSFCLVRYEDLHRDPSGELSRVLAVIGRSPSRKIIDDAVAFASFENMRERERATPKAEAMTAEGWAGRLSPENPTDTESYKTRKGKVGGFREYLTDDDIAYMNHRIAERLSPYYGEYLVPR
jgi:hypothetical protein